MLITKELDIFEGINYEGVELQQYEKYYGQVIIKFKKSFMWQGRFYKDSHQELVVQQILPTIYERDDFLDYDKVKLSHQQLIKIIHRGKRDWIATLENQKAVYLITDKSNGRLYVGSATSR